MMDNGRFDRGSGSGPAFTPESFLKWLPWGLAGVLVVLGLVITMSAGLPWETKEHAADQRALMQKDIQSLTQSQITLTGQVASLATSVGTLAKTISDWQAARDQEEKDRLKKMNLAADRRTSIERLRCNNAMEYQRRHFSNELRVDDAFIRNQANQ